MDSGSNSRPLLQPNSDSEDVNTDDGRTIQIVNEYGANASGNRIIGSDSDIEDDEDNEEEEEDFVDDVADTDNLFKATNTIPNDKFNYNYIVFYVLGMTTLLPWNFFVTAEDYWMYKFRNVSSNSTTDITPIQATFTSDLTFAASVPNTIVLIINAFFGHRIPLNIRINGSLILVLIFFMMNTALIEVNTDQWQDKFFDFTIFSVIIMNISTAILSGGLFGISGLFTSEYVTAVISGQALGGVFTAIVEIITLTFGVSAKTAAFVFFMIGNVILVVSLVAYIAMAKTEFFKYYTVERLALVKEQEERRSGHVEVEPSFRHVLNRIWLYGFTEWMVFAVTISVYPAVTVLINSQSHGNGHPWNDIYFIPVTNYLIFNSGDYLGRIVAGMIEWPRNQPYLVATMAILRIAFLPALLVCNTNPRHHFPVYIHSDYIFILLMCFFAFTNGYLANLAMIWAPRSVHSQEKEIASSTLTAFLGVGVAFGSTISLILVQIL